MASLPQLPTRNDVFIETTELTHQHGGPGWEYGTCLWSPTANRLGHDAYALMRAPAANDAVIHILKDHFDGSAHRTYFVGRSFVKGPAVILNTEPPSAGAWSGRGTYYRIDLRDYADFDSHVRLDNFLQNFEPEVRTELAARPHYYPFTVNARILRLNQGQYLTRCTPNLFDHLTVALQLLIPETSGKPAGDTESELEFTEGRRLSAERQFFARNPSLVLAAKKKYGFACQICGFEYSKMYGELGEGYIEAHHLNPLSERDPSMWTAKVRTSVDEVRVLCANCHRMIHRRRPALSIEDVRAALQGQTPTR
jgi:hypothetical protein